MEQILILRKLRIPLREIDRVLHSEESLEAITVFQEKIKELSSDILALTAVRTALEQFIILLDVKGHLDMSSDFLEVAWDTIKTLPTTTNHLKEEITVNHLNVADHHLSKLKEARILYVPPCTVASIHLVGGTPEYDTWIKLQQLMTQTNLASEKLDLRHYGFNHPNGVLSDGSDHGYERWVTIPDDMEVQEPFVKKKFVGGLYAAHMIPMGNFEEWGLLAKWVDESKEYEPNWGNPDCMYGSMEEHLNYINLYHLSNEEADRRLQLDLLLPIRPKSKE
ncbi:effector binding domain-containing protein [Paenibacillus sp. D2_2]|uniref:effector binding domain-containing protein n=1 Tax=Paenibacillus sp. D2_2 TaxID=3073092 RepID=UPI002814D0E5|nr:effector binding domain-containing protein [Paenibacillus sp. D2_2]WMT40899.1 effector binding domain-containing protein [Paenibacillus sp. D2_2]